MPGQYDDSILRALRRISRSIDLYSRHLARTHQLTGPQLICLRELSKSGAISPGQLARDVSLSAATVTGILDRLEHRGLVRRRRNPKDKRRVITSITAAGRELVAAAPAPLHHRLASGLERLSMEDQAQIASALESVVEMMEAEDLDAAPFLTAGPVATSVAEVADFLESVPGASSEPPDGDE